MDKVYYYNHKGRLKLTINEPPYYMRLDTGEFKNHAWGYDEQFGRFRNFRRQKVTYPFSIVITSRSLSDYDALCDIFNEDVIAGKTGYFLINGWRLDCNVIKADHQFYGELDHVIAFEAVSESSTWTRSVLHHYNGSSSGGGGSEDLGRNYSNHGGYIGRGYNYGYEEVNSHEAIIELHGTDNGFEAVIYGPAINPTLYINNEPITVYVSINTNERLRIVSNGPIRSIDILQLDGSSESAFAFRDKEHSPFLTLGEYNELSFGELRFDFTSIERRSEPSWI